MDIKEKVQTYMNEKEKEMIELQTILTSCPAVSPDSGGDGETEKGNRLVKWLKGKDLKISNFTMPLIKGFHQEKGRILLLQFRRKR